MLKAVSSRTIVPPGNFFTPYSPHGKFLTQKYVWPTEKRHQMYQVRLEQFLTVQLYPSGTSVALAGQRPAEKKSENSIFECIKGH